MKTTLISTVISAVLFAGAASASGWHHSAAAMGQFEGGFETDDQSFSLSYSCSPNYSKVSFSAKGIHISEGESRITVDGTEISMGNTVYNSKWDTTSFSMNVESEWGDMQKANHNALINALSGGSEATWTTPSNETFVYDLTGSSNMNSCLMN